LGVLKLERKGTVRYRYAWERRWTPGEGDTDEVTLTNGGVYRGRVKPGAREIELQHKLLGKVVIPVKAVRTLVRHSTRIRFLVDALPELQKTFPLLDEQNVRPRVARLASDRRTWARALRVEPRSILRWPQPTESGLSATFRTVLAPIARARGSVQVKLSVNGKSVFGRDVGHADEPVPVSVALPSGKSFTLEVEFGDLPLLPCGVVLADPHLVLGRP
jgi:hypothetical protein